MILPKVTLRRVFLLTALAGVFFAIGRYAFLGTPWALAISVAAVSAILIIAVHAVLFYLTSIVALTFTAARPKPESPFAETRQPPTLASPNDPSLE